MIIMQDFCLKRLKHLTVLIYFTLFVSLGFMRTTFAQDKAVDQKEESIDEKEPKEKPIFEIKPLPEGKNLYSIELRNVELGDFFRVIAHDYNLNILVDEKIKGKIVATFTNITLEEALERIAQMYNLRLEKKGNIFFIKPNLITKVFMLKYIRAEELLKPSQKEGGKEGKAQVAANTISDLLSEDGKILLGKELNSIVIIDYPPHVEKIEKFIKAVDQKLTTHIFKLKHLSVKELFPDLVAEERAEREKQREERKAEREELKEIRQKEESQ